MPHTASLDIHQPGTLGTPWTDTATKVLLLGSGELGKELAIELQRLGAQVVAVDRYAKAPAMQVAHSSHVIDMLDAQGVQQVIEVENPDIIVPEIEAIATQVLAQVESDPNRPQLRVVPTARATQLTMNREGIRRLAAEELGLATSPYRFVDSLEALQDAVDQLGLPVVVKPVMSSSGKGQSVIKHRHDIAKAWEYSQTGGRTASQQSPGAGQPAASRVIVEGFVDFDYEITLLTCRFRSGEDGLGQPITSTVFCPPVGHIQRDGDYRESWQPASMTDAALEAAREVAAKITEGLCRLDAGTGPSASAGSGAAAGPQLSSTGWGLFGVELFIKGDQVIFNEVSPRPHDTGLVTLVSQDVSEFAMHARAILGLPVASPAPVGQPVLEILPGQEGYPESELYAVDANEPVLLVGPEAVAASCAVLAQGQGVPVISGLAQAYAVHPSVQVRLFGKPRVDGRRRVAVTLARGIDEEEARDRARQAAAALRVDLV